MKKIVLFLSIVFSIGFGQEPISRIYSPDSINSVLNVVTETETRQGNRVTVTREEIDYLLTEKSAKDYFEAVKPTPRLSGWWLYLIPLSEFSGETVVVDEIQYETIGKLHAFRQLRGNELTAARQSCDLYLGEIDFLTSRDVERWIGRSHSREPHYAAEVAGIQTGWSFQQRSDTPEATRARNWARATEFPGKVRGMFWVGWRTPIENSSHWRTETHLAVVIDYDSRQEYAVYSYYKNDPATKLYLSRPVSLGQWVNDYENIDPELFNIYYQTIIHHLVRNNDDIEPLPDEATHVFKVGHLRTLAERGARFMGNFDESGSYFHNPNLSIAGTEMFTEDQARQNMHKLWWVDRKIEPQRGNIQFMETTEITIEGKDANNNPVTNTVTSVMKPFPRLINPPTTPRMRYVFAIDDYEYNSNPPIFKNIPDVRMYFGLYAQEFYKRIIRDEESPDPLSPGRFSNYIDYINYRMMVSVEDFTIYNDGDRPSALRMDTDQPPEEAYYYSHASNGATRLINNKGPSFRHRNLNPDYAEYLLVRQERRRTSERNWLRIPRQRTIAIPIDLNMSVGVRDAPLPSLTNVDSDQTSQTMAELFFMSNWFDAIAEKIYASSNNIQALDGATIDFFGEGAARDKEDLIVARGSFKVSYQLNSNETLQNIFIDDRQGEAEDLMEFIVENTQHKEFHDLSAGLLTLRIPLGVAITRSEYDSEGNPIKDTTRGDITYTMLFNDVIFAELREKRVGDWNQPIAISSIFADVVAQVGEAIENPQKALSGGIGNIHFVANANFAQLQNTEGVFIANLYDQMRPFSMDRNNRYRRHLYLYDEFGFSAGEPLQLHEKVINRRPNRLRWTTELYLKLRYPVVLRNQFEIDQIIGYIYFGDRAFCTNRQRRQDTQHVQRFLSAGTVIGNCTIPTTAYYTVETEIRINAQNEREEVILSVLGCAPAAADDDDYNELTSQCIRTVYYTFLLEQTNNLAPLKDSDIGFWPRYPTWNDSIEKWHSSGHNLLAGILGRHDYSRYSRPNGPSWVTQNFPDVTNWDELKSDGKIKNRHVLWQPRHIMIYDRSDTSRAFDLRAEYNKFTKEYYTDQKDLNERDRDIDRGKAIRDIILKIVVSEGLNLSMKIFHKIVDKYKYLIPVQVAAQKIEGKIANNIAYKIAKEAYRAYCIWRTTMDTAAQIRDSYRDMRAALQGLNARWNDLKVYYKNFDWNSVKMTNVSTILPGRQIARLRSSVHNFEHSRDRFMVAIDRMAFHSDTTLRGNYGPFNFAINEMAIQLAAGLNSTFSASDRIKDIVGVDYSFGFDGSYDESGTDFQADVREKNTSIMDNITGQTPQTASGAAYLSNITALAQTAVRQVSLNVLNDEINAMSIALMAIENDSRSWLQYHDYMSEMPNAVAEGIRKIDAKNDPKSYKKMIMSLSYPGNGRVFRSSANNALYQLQEWARNPKPPGDADLLTGPGQ